MEVLRGQSWVTLTSAREGTTDVTVYCPGVSPWQARTETCQVHWVDAQWSFPSIAVGESGGRQLLETTVSRQSDCTPRCGWIVRYEIVGGPPAGFAPDGGQVTEIPTGPDGKASVELYQTESQAGTSKISIQVIRPAGLGCPNKRIVVGQTCLSQTWSAPALGVRVLGPTAGSVGSNNGFRIDVSNPGDIAADAVTLTTPGSRGDELCECESNVGRDWRHVTLDYWPVGSRGGAIHCRGSASGPSWPIRDLCGCGCRKWSVRSGMR